MAEIQQVNVVDQIPQTTQARTERVDHHLALQLRRSIEHNARLVAALKLTLSYIDNHIIEIADVGQSKALLIAIDRALKGELNETRPTGGDATGAARES